MKKYIPCFYLLLFLFPSVVMSQDSISSRSIDIDEGNGYGHTLTKGFGDNYIIASFSTCSYEIKPCVGLVEIDNNLNTIQKNLYRNFDSGNNFSGRDGITVIDESRLAFISRITKILPDSSYLYSILLTIMDTEMNVLDTFHYDQDVRGIYFARSIHAVGDSSLLISGEEADPPGSMTMGGAWLKKVRLDDGEIIWERKFEKANFESKGFESLEVLSNGDILLGKQIKVAPWENFGRVTILDSEGKLKNELEFDEVIDVGYLPIRFIVTAMGDSTFGVNWGRHIGFDTTFLRYAPKVHKINRKGQELWNYEFKLERGTYKQIYSIRATDDDGIVGVGYADWWTFIPEEKILPTDPNSAGWAFKFSASGELEWQKFYYDPRHSSDPTVPTRNLLFDVIETNSGDFIMTGDKRDTIGRNSSNVNIWVLKTDSNGCLYGHYHCDTLQIVGDSTKRMLDLYTDVVYEWQDIETKVYPNPATKQLNIEFNEAFSGVVKIVNMEGKKVLEQAIKNKSYKTLNISTLSPGMYLLETFNVGKRKYSRTKVVVQ